MQKELTEGLLLNQFGDLSESGFAYQLVRQYDRDAIKVSKWRIKEWDYYYIGNKEHGLALTVADNSYMWLVSITTLDFTAKSEITSSPLGFFSFGKVNLPSTSKSGDVYFSKKGFFFSFKHENGKRHIQVSMDKFGKKKEKFRCDVILKETNKDTMVIATPFAKPGHFYYNQKINLLESSGYYKVGDSMVDLSIDTFGVLDWGRGVWTYKNTWYWSSLNGTYKGKRIGWNLGYGFGDTSSASENMFFYDDRAYKLEDVKFDIPISNHGGDDFMRPWHIRSLKGDINADFYPIYDRHSDSNVGLIRSNQHQVFGRFTGYLVIDGREIYFEDLPGFAEKVYNRW